jgi:ABC-type multidrug transport system ATPase subunit
MLLLDEPSMGLAPIIVEEVFSTIVKLKAMGAPVLLVEQNANMALSIADRGYVLETGRIVLGGKASDLAKMDFLRSRVEPIRRDLRARQYVRSGGNEGEEIKEAVTRIKCFSDKCAERRHFDV